MRADATRDVPARPGVTLRMLLAAVAVVLLIAAGLVAALLWPARVAAVAAWVTDAERRLGAAGWAMAALIQLAIALSGVLPASLGAIAAGAAYGTIAGFLLCGSATLIAAALAFLLARSLFRAPVARMLARHPRLARLQDGVAREGWSIVCLLRLSPVMPFAATSYALGLTAISLRAYMLGTLASLPALFLYVVSGQLAEVGLHAVATGPRGWLRALLLGMALIGTLVLTVRLGRILARALRLAVPIAEGVEPAGCNAPESIP